MGKSLVKPWTYNAKLQWLNIYIYSFVLSRIVRELQEYLESLAYLILGFIDHSFEEHRKILKRKQLEGSIVNVKLI